MSVLVIIQQSIIGYLVLTFWYCIMGFNYYGNFGSVRESLLWFIQFPKPLRLELNTLPIEVYSRIALMMSEFPELRSSLIKIIETPRLRKDVMTKLPYGYPKGMCNNVLRVCLSEGYITTGEHSTYLTNVTIIETLPAITDNERDLYER